MKKAIAAGHICIDITPVFPDTGTRTKNIGELLRPGTLLQTMAPDIHSGGSVANTGLGMKLMGADVPLYTLNEGKSIMMVPFGEEIELVDGKLYMSAESTMLPSVYYNIWNGRKCRAIPIENID
jgi:hypothetical protein